jgi:hypothetical protein
MQRRFSQIECSADFRRLNAAQIFAESDLRVLNLRKSAFRQAGLREMFSLQVWRKCF